MENKTDIPSADDSGAIEKAPGSAPRYLTISELRQGGGEPQVALVVATDGLGRILMGKRLDNKLWTLPGGHVNFQEPVEDAAKRELNEETGLEPKSLTFMFEQPPQQPGAPRLHVFSALVTGIPHGRNDPDHECDDWQWIDTRGGIPANIWDSLHGPEGDANILRRIFEMRGLEKGDRNWLDAGFMDLRKGHTPEFEQWFAGSHVKDTSGAPLQVYHGTSKDRDFHTFKIGQRGAWFTADPKEAGQYAEQNDSQSYRYEGATPVRTNTAARVIPAYLSLKNPYYMTPEDMQALNTAAGKSSSADGYKRPQAQLFQQLRAKGHDGVVMPGNKAFVAFQPHQIKSVFNRKPTTTSGHLSKTEASDAYTLLAHPDPRERAMALKLGDATPHDVAAAILDPDPWVWRVAFKHPDSAHALDVLAASHRDAAGVPIYDRHDALLKDPRCHAGHIRSMHTAVKDDVDMPLEIRAQRIRGLLAHPLATHLQGDPLQKHWGHRKISRETGDTWGTVNPSEDAHMSHLGHMAEAFKRHVGGATPMTPTDADLHESGVTSPKVVYKFPVAGHSEDRRFMVKPYGERGFPLSGWGEGTSQALYHASGIGHLHQQSFPVVHGHGETLAPAVAIHIEDATPVHQVPRTQILQQNPDAAEDARRIGIMDFLTGNNDRNTSNLMVRPGGKLLAIDHGQAFQYGDGDNLHWFTQRGASAKVHSNMVPNAWGQYVPEHDTDFAPTFEWWKQNGADIRRALQDRLKLIKSPKHAANIQRHFDARASYLDRMASSPRAEGWDKEPINSIPLGKALGQRDFLFEHSDSPIESDHEMMAKAHHPSHQPRVDEFEHNLNAPEQSHPPVMGKFTGHEPKAVYQHAGSGYLVKPADVEPPSHYEGEHVPAVPSAWNELTSQALYHAAGLGHLHQGAHFTSTRPGQEDTDVPPRGALVVHMHPDLMTWDEAKEQDHGRFSALLHPDNLRAIRRIGMMDVATGNFDRHTGNIGILPNGQPLAIDNGFAFELDHAHASGEYGFEDPAEVIDNHLHHSRHGYSDALAIGGDPDEQDWAWWNQAKPAIMAKMNEHLGMLSDKDHRAAVRDSMAYRVNNLQQVLQPNYGEPPVPKPASMSDFDLKSIRTDQAGA
jgi:ADP-ribose pyrophosphatase YjhB (NUDIX family)